MDGEDWKTIPEANYEQTTRRSHKCSHGKLRCMLCQLPHAGSSFWGRAAGKFSPCTNSKLNTTLEQGTSGSRLRGLRGHLPFGAGCSLARMQAPGGGRSAPSVPEAW